MTKFKVENEQRVSWLDLKCQELELWTFKNPKQYLHGEWKRIENDQVLRQLEHVISGLGSI